MNLFSYSRQSCCLIRYWGHEDNPKSQLWSSSLSWRAAKSFKNVAAHKLGNEFSSSENHSELHLQGTQGCTALSEWKFAAKSCKNRGNTCLHVCYGHMDICLNRYLHTYMYTYRHMSIKQREAHVYTTYRAGKGSTKAQSPTAVRAEAVQVYTDVFSPTYHKNINT